MPTEVRVSKQGPVATLTLSSPDQLNVLSRTTLTQFGEALEQLSRDSELHALVLAGEGTRSFSAGADLNELVELDEQGAKEYAEFGQNLAQTLARFPVVTIAALQAPVYGGGVELALACDFRLASPRTVLHYQAAKLGLLPGWGGTQRLPLLVGRSRAKAMMIMCQPIEAQQALAWGLVDAVSDGPDLAPLVKRWTDDLEHLARHSTIQIKRALDLGANGDFAGEREAFAACFAHEGPQTLIRQWLARQKPAAADA